MGEAAHVLNTEIAKKTYDDLAANALKEGGGLIVDVIKTVRLLTYFPFRFCSVTFDKIQAGIEDAKSRVPEDRQVGAHPSIAMPVLERIGYEDDDSILREMYVNLLARSIDKERQGEAHPAFARIIEQLSPDEAMIMYTLRKASIVLRQHQRECNVEPLPPMWILLPESPDVVRKEPFPYDRLANPKYDVMHFPHLESLSLVEAFDPITCLYSRRSARYAHVALAEMDYSLSQYDGFVVTEFGRVFTNACVPEDFELPKSSSGDADSET